MAAPFIFRKGRTMGTLTLFALGFAAGSAFCAAGLTTVWIVVLMVLLGGGFGAAVYFRKKLQWLKTVAIGIAGLFFGLGWFLLFQFVYLNHAISMDGKTEEVVIQTSGYSSPSEYGGVVDGYVRLEGKSYQVRVYLDEYTELEPGDEVSGSFRFRVTTDDGENIATYHQGKGIFLIAYQEGKTAVAACEKTPLRFLPMKLRMQVNELLRQLFPGDTYAFAQALLLGNTLELDYATDTALKLSGIRHVVAVSGLHVSILYGMISVLTGKRKVLTAILGLPLLLIFAAVAGFTPSVARACIMVGLMMIAMLFDREYDPPSALSFAVLVLLVVNPLAITSAALQLSAASVCGIFLLGSPISGWSRAGLERVKVMGKKLPGWIAASVSVSLSATILTTPVSAWYFGTVSLVSILTNLLTLFVISFVFYGIFGVCLLGLLWETGAMFLAEVVSWPIRYVLTVSKFLGGLPLAAVYTRNPYMILWLVLLYALLAVFLLSKKKRPLELGCCAAIGLCLALVLSWTEPLLDECRVTVLDVGQGQSILLQSEGRTYLVDCGGDRDDETANIIAETLLSQGINRLDGIILTHCDRDHCGSLWYLLSRIETDLLVIPSVDSENISAFAAENSDGLVVLADEDLQISWGGADITVFVTAIAPESNENSLCILFSTENCDILITGDRSEYGERRLLRHTELPQVDVLIAGHHGSKHSTCVELLDAVRPETVIISAGARNPYGHPAEETLDRLEEAGCDILRTDLNGTVIFRR